MSDLTGRVVLITGAAAGIGKAVVELCVAAGARQIVLVDRNAEALDAVRLRFAPDALALVADVGEVDAAPGFVEKAMSQYGRIDVAMLNAGMVGRIARIEAVTAAEFDRVMAVNVRSVWSGLAALFPAMKINGGGSIVVTASTGGLAGAPMVAPYIASKHAVIGLVKAAAIEGAKFGIRVNAVAPSPVDTDMMREINQGLGGGDIAKSRARTIAHVPLQRFATAQEIARTMVFLGSDSASFTTGSAYIIDGGMTAGVYP